MDEKQIKDLMIAGLLVKLITIADGETDPFYQHLMSNTYAMLDGVKAHMQGEATEEDEDFSSKYNITDDDDGNDANQGGATT